MLVTSEHIDDDAIAVAYRPLRMHKTDQAPAIGLPYHCLRWLPCRANKQLTGDWSSIHKNPDGNLAILPGRLAERAG